MKTQKRPIIFNFIQISEEGYKPSKESEDVELFLQKKEFKFDVNKCLPNIETFEVEIGELSTVYSSAFPVKIGADYYDICIEDDVLISNPDPNDPKVKPPSGQSPQFDQAILDPFIPIKNEYLQAAANNSFANYIFNNNESSDNREKYYPVVAIIDSGIDLRYFSISDDSLIAPLHYYKSLCALPENNCGCNKHEDYIYGYNIYNAGHYAIEPQNPFDNEGYHKHGTRIAKLIASICNNNVRLMPLKTADHTGRHRLSDIYKALQYVIDYNSRTIIETDKVKIINCSWSFNTVNKPVIMERLMNQLNNQGVIVVTSAGNEGKILGNSNNTLYPAMFSTNSNRIFTVTTVRRLESSYEVVENRSQDYVDIGILSNSQGRFKDPLDNGYHPQGIEGSSYAAAIYSGYLARQLSNGIPLTDLIEVNTPISLASLARDRGNSGNIVSLDSVV